MSILKDLVIWAERIEGMNGISDAIQKIADSDTAIDYAAAGSQLVAELAIATATTLTIRTAMSTLRLGLAISGQIWKWEALSKLSGVGAGLTAGAIIDWVNSQDVGSRIYEATHVDPLTNKYWWESMTPPRRDPLAIDLDGDGIETVGAPTTGATTGTPILFDHDADGIKTGTGWVKSDDAWLVLDRNGNGTIDTGRELFGVDTMITVQELAMNADGSFIQRSVTRNARNGFEALRSLDTGNGNAESTGYADGVFDASDAQFANVRLWRDLNQDGVSQSNELFTLADSGVTSISLTPTTSTSNLGNGNTVSGTATVQLANGGSTVADTVEVAANNLDLASNPFYRSFTDSIPLTDAALALPNMGGSGLLRDLREAMSLGTSQADKLTNAVRAFSDATTRDAQLALLDQLLVAWAETGPDLSAGLKAMPGRYVTLASGEAGGHGGADVFADMFGEDLDKISTIWRELLPTADFGGGSDSAKELLDLAKSAGLTTGVEYLLIGNAAMTEVMVGLPLYKGVDSLSDPLLQHIGVLQAFNGQEFLSRLVADGSNVNGLAATWRFSLVDTRVAGFMNQAYDALRESVYGALVVQTRLRPYFDDVNLVIDDSGIHLDATPVGTDLLARAAVNRYDAVGDLLDLEKYSGDSFQALGYSPMVTLEQVLRSAPIEPEIAPLLSQAKVTLLGADSSSFVVTETNGGTILANSLDNALTGNSNGVDQLFGLAGNDTLTAVGNGDLLDGGDGNDVLNISGSLTSGTGTTYIGGRGNDTMTGTYIGDSYVFNAGDGQDIITDNSVGFANTDVLKFGAGINATDVTPVRSGEDLIFKLSNGTDQITVKNWFTSGNGYYQLEQVKFDDGTVWTSAQVNTRALEVFGTTGNDSVTGVSAFSDTLRGGAGNDTLTAVGNNDTLDGGDGNDVLNISGGLTSGTGTTYIGGQGNDTMTGTYIGDSYLFNVGDGQDIITDNSVGFANTDVLKFGAGINATDVTPVRSGEDLIFKLSNGTDQITVKNWFTSGNGYYQLEQIKFDDGTVWTSAQVNTRALEVFGTTGNDSVTGVSAFSDTLRGGAGNDTLTAVGNNDTLDGGDGNDVLNISGGLTSGTGTTYIGGQGNDTMTGTYIGDSYVFNAGDGQDIITDNSVGFANTDVLKFGAGINATDVTPVRSGEDLIFKLSNGTDQITVKNWFTSGNGYYQLEQVKFDDGTVWTNTQLNSSFNVMSGTTGSDVMTGVVGKSNIMSGLDGDDSLVGNSGADRLDGGLGIDTMRGGAGNDTYVVDNVDDIVIENASDGIDFIQSSVSYLLPDDVENLTLTGTSAINGTGNSLNNVIIGSAASNVLTGSAGNDTLMGGAGNDTYVWGRDDGAESIFDYDATAGNTDVLSIGSAVSTDQLWFRRIENDLEISIIGTSDKVTVSSWYLGSSYHVEQLGVADGSVLLDSQVDNLVNAMASFAPPAAGQNTLPDDYRTSLGPIIAANWHS